ncbi:dephospho-CoA kinase [Methylibium sp.]|uniref:dephospho-CoA kinase n=1 Tax=Methylibium sp. TaxID=2067992 RepID=UPI003D146C2B
MGTDRAALRIGLTGGIGSGKSTVAALLARRGALLIDTDAIARSLAAPGGGAVPALRAHFGPDCIDAQGGLDRAWMRERAFTDPVARVQLEAILHPLIRAGTEDLAARGNTGPCIVFDVPLLVESGHWRDRVDRVLVVDCPVEVQIERVVRRSHWTHDEVRRVIVQQATREARRAAADAVIDNRRDTLDALQLAVEALWTHWIERR